MVLPVSTQGGSSAKWVSLRAGASSALVAQLDSVKQTVSGVTSVLTTILEAAKTIANLILKFVIALDDPQAAAIRALADTALAILDDIEKNAHQLYALGVPPVDPNVQIGDWGNVTGLQGDYLTLGDGTRIKLAGGGGNAGFIRTVAESMEDSYDENRPRFGEDSLVAGAVLITGADTYLEAIKLIRKLQKLFSTLSIDDQRYPRPRNVQAQPIAPTGQNKYEVKVSWEPEPVVSILDIYGNPRYSIREVVIYRSDWDKNLPRGDLSKYEVARIEYNGFQTNWHDTDFPSIQPRPAWRTYGVGFALNEIDSTGVETEIAEPMVARRASACVGPGGVQPARDMGLPPDWYALGLFDLIPPIGVALSAMRQFIEDQKDAAEAASSQMKQLVDELSTEITRYTDFAESVASVIQELIDLLAFPEGYFGFASLGPFKGGNETFVQQLKEAMTDVNDANRPKFDKGTEIVAGVVLLIGTNTSGATALSAVIDLLGALFGGVRDEAMQTSRDLRAAVQAAQEQICLNEALIKKICSDETETETLLGANLEASLTNPLCSG